MCHLRQEFFWWELMEMLRRFLLVGLFVVWPYDQGSIMQVAMANLTALLYLAIQLQVSPYRRRVDDHLALGCSLSLSVMLLCTIFYKYVSLIQLPSIRDRMVRQLVLIAGFLPRCLLFATLARKLAC
jgi:hypothetical protein